MEVRFNDRLYKRLETDKTFTHNLPTPVVSTYRMCLQLLRAATSEQDLNAMRMLGLKSRRASPHAEHLIRLIDGYHLVFELRSRSSGRFVWIVGVAQPNAIP